MENEYQMNLKWNHVEPIFLQFKFYDCSYKYPQNMVNFWNTKQNQFFNNQQDQTDLLTTQFVFSYMQCYENL